MLTDHFFGRVFNQMMIDILVAVLCGGAIGLGYPVTAIVATVLCTTLLLFIAP